MKTAFFELEDWQIDYFRKQKFGKNIKLSLSSEKLTQKNASKIKDFEGICTFIYSKLDEKLLSTFKNLKFICTLSTGFDHINLNYCKNKKIQVFNVPTYGENTVAEHTMALILNISRRIFDSILRTRSGKFVYDGLRGFDLKGKTLGLVGGGHIGINVAKMARGFDMNILVYDIKQDPILAEKIGFKYVKNLDDLLKHSDIISLHTPYNKFTHHIINIKNIKKVKPGAVLINTARGGLIQTDALVFALNRKIISYAGLDVLEEEKPLKEDIELLSKHRLNKKQAKTILEEHVLLEQPNVYITPHNAFNSPEALKRIMDTTIENIRAYLAKKPINRVA